MGSSTFFVAYRIFGCGMWDPDEGSNSGPSFGAWSLNHWTVREVSKLGVVKGEGKD